MRKLIVDQVLIFDTLRAACLLLAKNIILLSPPSEQMLNKQGSSKQSAIEFLYDSRST
jgi:hypothetical protein